MKRETVGCLSLFQLLRGIVELLVGLIGTTNNGGGIGLGIE